MIYVQAALIPSAISSAYFPTSRVDNAQCLGVLTELSHRGVLTCTIDMICCTSFSRRSLWYCLEYQSRESTYAHECAKLKNDTRICELVKKAAAAWLVIQDNENIDCNIQRIIDEGEEAKVIALKYIDWLVTVFNEDHPNKFWRIPVPHPYSVAPCDVMKIITKLSTLITHPLQ